jgi:NAD(P)-dependent dehydrogenase (short-subunit alcohol dehydrogenase family)
VLFDVTDKEAVRAAAGLVREKVGEDGLFGLVNNAGICLMGSLMHMPEQQVRNHFEINVFGLLDVTRVFLPLLGASRDCRHPPGRIVNLSSVSGRIAYPFLGAYAASKFAVEALSDSLRRELLIYGIDVIAIEPGAVRTPIWDKGLDHDISPYAATDYAPIVKTLHDDLSGQRDDALPVEAVSRVIRRALTVRRPKTRYVVPNSPLTRWWIPHWLPDRWLDFVVARHLGYRKATRQLRGAEHRRNSEIPDNR